MKRILVVGAGGTPAANFTRSLRAAPEPFYMIGTDCDKYNLQRAETDERYLVPRATDPDYIDILNEIIGETDCQFLHIQNDVEMKRLSEDREKLQSRTFLPDKESVRNCLSKWDSYARWKANGIKVPASMILMEEDDLKTAFREFGDTIWVRDQTGAGGRGSIIGTDFNLTKTWIDYHKGWGQYLAAQCLRPESVTWLSIWYRGQLIVAQGRKRLYWELGKVAISGVSGVTGTGVTVADPLVDEVAQKCISAISPQPHGIYGVDMTYDDEGIPNPTEINIGRFFTTHDFFTRLGLNMPYIFVKLGLDGEIPQISPRINPLPEGMAWIRGVDFLPVLTTLEEIEHPAIQLTERRKRRGG